MLQNWCYTTIRKRFREFHMFTTFFLFLIGFGCHHKKPLDATIEYTKQTQAENFLYEAILTGLKEDNVSSSMMKTIKNSKGMK